MNIILVEPFFTGSHRSWALGFQAFSRHRVAILSLPGRYWKWRMYGGAVSLAKQLNDLIERQKVDLLLCTDMLDLTTFLSLTRQSTAGIPIVVYFHENQITYPWSPDDADLKLGRNNQYGFLNYTTALAADRVFFNSPYHLASFLGALPDFLNQFPDFQELDRIAVIRQKSAVLPLGMDLRQLDKFKITPSNTVPLILWNHRWEYDKNPNDFFNILFQLDKEGIDFELAVLGEGYQKSPPIFAKATSVLKNRIAHFGFVQDFSTYAKWLWKSDVLPVTGHQDFFGGSVVEAIYTNTFPLLPNRLAYPMHIPAGQHPVHFYDGTKTDLYQKLKSYLLDFPNQKNKFSGQDYVKRYDWRTLAREYDEVLEQLKA